MEGGLPRLRADSQLVSSGWRRRERALVCTNVTGKSMRSSSGGKGRSYRADAGLHVVKGGREVPSRDTSQEREKKSADDLRMEEKGRGEETIYPAVVATHFQ